MAQESARSAGPYGRNRRAHSFLTLGAQRPASVPRDQGLVRILLVHAFNLHPTAAQQFLFNAHTEARSGRDPTTALLSSAAGGSDGHIAVVVVEAYSLQDLQIRRGHRQVP